MNYEEMLARGKELTEDLSETGERFSYPDPESFKEGTTTVLRNFSDIASALNREEEHLLRFLNRQLGTAGKIQGDMIVFQGDFSSDEIESRLENYVEEYVLCSECMRPDTRLVRVNRTQMLKCDACGARMPVKKGRQVKAQSKARGLVEGETYEMKITGTGRKGDGVARLKNKTVFVSNAEEGEVVRARIDNISGSMAWATAIERTE
ncbi:MAG: Translation initiation factor 2 subunit beta [Methanonatronarchaeales archaeon]|nr:Translation initiation factor 2 subunit beta [Methanonatronarchaeales archaeon]